MDSYLWRLKAWPLQGSRAARLWPAVLFLLCWVVLLVTLGGGAAAAAPGPVPEGLSAADWSQITAMLPAPAAPTEQGYLKASNVEAGDQFGRPVAVDGDTVVVGADSENGNGTDGPADNSASTAGAAYVFTRSGATWSQQAYLKASNAEAVDQFGAAVAVDGDTIVVGAFAEDGNGTDGPADNSASQAGAAYVFTRSSGSWSQQAYLKASNAGTADVFGWSVAVDGDTVVVGAFTEDGNGTDGPADNSASNAGAAYVFTRSGATWSQQAYLKSSYAGANDQFGYDVAVDGDTVVAGAFTEDGNGTDGPGDNSASQAGAAYVFDVPPPTGTIVIVKVADPEDDTPFSFTEDITDGGGTFTLSDPTDNTKTFLNVPAGIYNVTEDGETGWTLDGIGCIAPNSETIFNPIYRTAVIDLAADETVTCTFYNVYTPVTDLFMSATVAGTTGDGQPFGPHDVLRWNGFEWSLFFDGSAAGLTPNGAAKHNTNAVWVPDSEGNDLVLAFAQNARLVPGISPAKVDGMDLVWYDGDANAFSLWFDGNDVGLTNKTQEKIDALHVLDGSAWPFGNSSACEKYLLISTAGPGKVTNHSGGTLNFSGEDVLGFCATNLGPDTTGLWHMVLDGSAQGMPKNSTTSLSATADGQTLYLTTKGAFNVDGATGGHSMVYAYDTLIEAFSGPLFNAPANGLPNPVDGLDVVSLAP